MIPYGRQTIEEDDIQAVTEVLRSDWLTQGPKVGEFEEALANYGEATYAVVFSNGSCALQAAYFAAGIKPGDEIISSPITFAATTNAALWFGAKPVFVDVLKSSGNLNPALTEKAITKRTKIIAPVDFCGHPVDSEAFMKMAKKNNCIVVEDGCHALGALRKGKKVGGLSDMTVYSFHPVKSITTGEGGAVLTNNHEYYERMKQFRHHGISKEKLVHPNPSAWYYEMQDLGLNARLTDLQSALGLSQLRKVDRFIERRHQIAKGYQAAFENITDVRSLAPESSDLSSWHLFVLVLENRLGAFRDEIFNKLKERGIGVQVHYIPVHRHPYYESLGYKVGLCPVAEDLSRRVISLPIYPTLTDDQQKTVIDTVKSIISEIYENSLSR